MTINAFASILLLLLLLIVIVPLLLLAGLLLLVCFARQVCLYSRTALSTSVLHVHVQRSQNTVSHQEIDARLVLP
jgi:hypothetical protein